MSTTTSTPSAVKTLRHFVTVVACDLRYRAKDLDRRGEVPVGEGLDALECALAEIARSSGGLALPLHGSLASAVFGYPSPDPDHAARALQCARLFTDAIAARRESGWVPDCGVGIHSADSLILEQGPRTSRRVSLSGPSPDCAAALARVARNCEILVSESALQSFSANLPPGVGCLQVEFEEEPDLDGMNWESVVFLGLPEHLRRQAVLAGHGMDASHANAEYFFRYLFAMKILSSQASLNVLSLAAMEDAPAFQLASSPGGEEPGMTRLGSYTLLSKLGSGGTGQVWLARDFFGNLVAVKALQDAYAADARQIARLQREAQAMASLPHPNICRIIEVGESDGIHFIAMEYIAGICLADLLRPEGGEASLAELIRRAGLSDPEGGAPPPSGLPFRETLHMMMKVCDAVGFAHDHGILHRDLKPGNILLREAGDPVVTDFGLAKIEVHDAAGTLSLSGEILGTLEYMSPEQAHDSKNVDERADIYSLGAILYILLTGRRHFVPCGDILKDAANLQDHEPKPVRSIVRTVPADLAVITEKCLRRHPRDRYQTARMLRDDLNRLLLRQPVLARPPSPLRVTREWAMRHRTVVGTVAAAVLTMVLFSIYSFAQINRKRVEAEAALAAVDAARASGAANQDRAIAAMQTSERHRLQAERYRLQAEQAEQQNEELAKKWEAEQSKLERARALLEEQREVLAKRREAFLRASRLVVPNTLVGTDRSPPPEPLRKTDPAASGASYLRRYSGGLMERLSAAMLPLLENDQDAPSMEDAKVDEIKFLTRQLAQVSQGDPEAQELLSRLGVLGIPVAPGFPVLSATALREKNSVTDHQYANLAETFARTGNPFERQSSSEALFRWLEAESGGPTFYGEPIQMEWSPGSDLRASGSNDRNIALVEEFAAQAASEFGPLALIDLSYAPVSSIPWGIYSSCRELQARKSAAKGFSPPRGAGPLALKKLDLANSGFADAGTLPRECGLEHLNVNNCPITDLGFLADFPKLQELFISGIPAPTVEGVSRLKELRVLRFSPDLIKDRNSIELLRGLGSLERIGTGGRDELLPAKEFWMLWDEGWFRGEQARQSSAPEQKNAATPAPGPSPTASPSPEGEQAPAGGREGGSSGPQAAAEIDGIVVRMNEVFASLPAGSPPEAAFAKLRPLIREWRDCLGRLHADSPRDPAGVLLGAKFHSLLLEADRSDELLRSSADLAAKSSDTGLAEECQTLQQALRRKAGGGSLITPFGLRRTGTPENIRLAALYENLDELARGYAQMSGRPFDPKLLGAAQEAPGR